MKRTKSDPGNDDGLGTWLFHSEITATGMSHEDNEGARAPRTFASCESVTIAVAAKRRLGRRQLAGGAASASQHRMDQQRVMQEVLLSR